MSSYDVKVWSSEEDIKNGRMTVEINPKPISTVARLEYFYQDPDGRGRAHQFWKNFMAYIHTFTKTPEGVWHMAFRLLAEYNATIVDDDYIKFETDEDKLLFLLRWS
jgi:hypothetical protein